MQPASSDAGREGWIDIFFLPLLLVDLQRERGGIQCGLEVGESLSIGEGDQKQQQHQHHSALSGQAVVSGAHSLLDRST